ncbi:MAG: hypothetical protein Fues2KO_53470 [Fuerstiella sp.]
MRSMLSSLLLSLSLVSFAAGIVGCSGNVNGVAGTCIGNCSAVAAGPACPVNADNSCTGDSTNCTGGGASFTCSCKEKIVNGENWCYCKI